MLDTSTGGACFTWAKEYDTPEKRAAAKALFLNHGFDDAAGTFDPDAARIANKMPIVLRRLGLTDTPENRDKAMDVLMSMAGPDEPEPQT